MNSDKQKIIIQDLTFSYNNTTPVLNNTNVIVNERDIVTIIGQNGGGKTTLLKLILGVLQPQKGSILIDGKPPLKSRKKMGYVPQHSLFDEKFPITAEEIVLSGALKNFGYYSKKDKIKATDSLEKVELAHIRNDRFNDLSGGQKQRILIARSLMTDAEILLLDEPTSNIDPAAGNSLNSLLQKLNEKITILLVTHDIGFVGNITNRVLCVNKSVVEHPIDEDFSQILSSSYSSQSMIVRHERSLSEDHCHGGDNCE